MAAKRISLGAALRTSSQLTPRAAAPTALRSFATSASRASRPLVLSTRPSARATAAVTASSSSSQRGVRWSSESATGSKIYSFEEIRALSKDASRPLTIVDVREPGELASTGRIPGAVNVPITTAPDSFHIADDEFADRFGFERPGKADEVVFYCKAGVRSRAAAGIARDAGWTRVGEYPGSWIDWAGKGGEIERS
ncbi:hypothetical protein JX265_012082 [Neoarthrinium moseri]|uniref:Rhodanese domain-containing protein n=1 Tax=Neoarthrinium moseri TaxID=1658444 RepID=A0A9P9WAW1_9PEZI|nr:hypothetical protein JX266_004852 [Neoarthrinium moseri]KAI1855819.1 hypothetical protein JX265_012082 [Neoarthrinium moseri]